MKKSLRYLLASLLAFVGIGAQAQVVYDVTKWGNSTHSERYTNSISLTTSSGTTTFTGIQTGTKQAIYWDRTSEMFTCAAGETLTAAVGFKGSWMNAYVYIDENGDGFSASDDNIGDDHILKTSTDIDLRSYSKYNGGPNGGSNYNSEGESVEGKTYTLPSFAAPTNPGTYRMRYKVDWNCIDPEGNEQYDDTTNPITDNRITNNGGIIVDVMLKVEASATVTVNHIIDGTTFNTEVKDVPESAWVDYTPAALTCGYGVTASTTPQTLTAAGATFDVIYTTDWSAYPFEVSDLSYGFTNDDKFYTLKIRGTKNVVYSGSGTASNSATEPGLTAGKYFCITGNNMTGFHFHNLLAGSDKAMQTDGTYGDTPQGYFYEYNKNQNMFRLDVNYVSYINDNSSKFGVWNSSAAATDAGGAITFTIADADDLVASAKTSFIGATATVSTTGEYGDYTQTYVDAVNAIVDDVAALTTLEDVLGYKGATVEPSYILPSNAFIRLKGAFTSKYATADDSGEKSQGKMVDDKTANTIFWYDAEGYMTNYANGLRLYETSIVAGVGEGNTYTFASSANGGVPYVTAYSNHTSTNGHLLFDHGDKGYLNRNSVVAGNRTDWTIEAVTALPVTLSDYALFSAPVAVEIPAGVTAYVVTKEWTLAEMHEDVKASIKEPFLAVKALTGVIPANTAVILAGTGDYDLTITTTAEEATSLLTATTTAINKPENARFVVSTTDGKFYLDSTEDPTIKGFSAYYEASDAIRIDFDGDLDATATAIEAANSSLESGRVYNIRGQRVEKAGNGLFIVNGKKIMVK